MSEMIPSSPEVSERMARVRSRDTAPELALRRELHRRGLRYRVAHRIPGLARIRPDIVFTKAKLAVFVDGCFWHSCPQHATSPRSNADWWVEKLARNVARDRSTDMALADLGWFVIRVWEHESPETAAARVENELTSRR